MQAKSSQDRRLVKTSTPGVYKRGGSYIVRYRDPRGRSRKRFARTLAEARDLRAQLGADLSRGEYRERSKVSFREYAETWLDTYQGRTSRGVRPETLAEYRCDLERDAIPYFGRMRLAEIEPRDVKQFAAHVANRGLVCRVCARWDEVRRRTCKKCTGTGRIPGRVSPGTVRLAVAPVRALLATAFEEGLIRSNPAAGVRIAQRVETDEETHEEERKALSEEELQALVEATPDEWRLLIEFLAQTGLRISEALALRWSEIDFGRRRVLVRRRLRAGSFGPPKSRYGRRDVPLSSAMARRLWVARGVHGEQEPVFAATNGGYLDAENLRRRVVKTAAKSAGVEWAAFHTLRHTCASMLFRRGLNAKQVQVWLGHHSPAFTLSTYVHLLPEDLPEPPDLFAPFKAVGVAVPVPVLGQAREVAPTERLHLSGEQKPHQAREAGMVAYGAGVRGDLRPKAPEVGG